MALVNDLLSIEDFVKSKFPTAHTEKQTVPLQPNPNTFVIRYLGESREVETAAHYRIDREYDIIYIGATAADVLTQIDALGRALYQTKLIPIKDSLRYIRVESFSISRPFETENDLFACIAVLQTEIREARDQEEYDLMQHVYARQETN